MIHHLVVDAVSWLILLDDLATAYAQLRDAPPVSLPPVACSFQQWAAQLLDYSQAPATRRQLSYWLEQGAVECSTLPIDAPPGIPGGIPDEASAHRITTTLAKSLPTPCSIKWLPPITATCRRSCLAHSPKSSPAGAKDVPWLDVEGHGREDLFEPLDLSRTVGWFTTLFPLRLTAGSVGPEQFCARSRNNGEPFPSRDWASGCCVISPTRDEKRLASAAPC